MARKKTDPKAKQQTSRSKKEIRDLTTDKDKLYRESRANRKQEQKETRSSPRAKAKHGRSQSLEQKIEKKISWKIAR
jgi:ElaB/YqjD/DUF883 family membrane-anchored ribosome-binding protein